MKLKVKRLHPDAKLPTRAYAGDLGYDLYSSARVVLRPLEPVAVPTGISVEFPDGWGAFIKDRSSMALKGVHTLAGVIDGGYRGEIRIVMVSLAGEVVIEKGQKIAQMVPVKVVSWEVVEGDPSPSEREDRGFGSSGD